MKNTLTFYLDEYGNKHKAEIIPNLSGIKILSEYGFRSFDGLIITKNRIIELYFSDESFLECTEDQKIFIDTGEQILAKEMEIGQKIKKGVFLIYKEKTNRFEEVFDPLNIPDKHSFYANGILVSQCIFLDEFAHIDNTLADQFFTSVYPTVSSGNTTKVVVVSTPLGMNHFHKMWVEAEHAEKLRSKGKIAEANKISRFIPIDVHYTEVPGRDEEWREQEIANLGSDEKFEQEYMCFHRNTILNIVDLENGDIEDVNMGDLYEKLQALQDN